MGVIKVEEDLGFGQQRLPARLLVRRPHQRHPHVIGGIAGLRDEFRHVNHIQARVHLANAFHMLRFQIAGDKQVMGRGHELS